jgi:hypothetical protein
MNRRRSERVLLQMRVVVSAEMEGGKMAHTEAFTLVVNAHGGLLELGMKVNKGQKLLLTNPGLGAQQSCKVVSVKSSQDGCFATAFEFDSPTPQFWLIDFPPTDWSLMRAKQ